MPVDPLDPGAAARIAVAKDAAAKARIKPAGKLVAKDAAAKAKADSLQKKFKILRENRPADMKLPTPEEQGVPEYGTGMTSGLKPRGKGRRS
jgi:hypothetical protein